MHTQFTCRKRTFFQGGEEVTRLRIFFLNHEDPRLYIAACAKQGHSILHVYHLRWWPRCLFSGSGERLELLNLQQLMCDCLIVQTLPFRPSGRARYTSLGFGIYTTLASIPPMYINECHWPIILPCFFWLMKLGNAALPNASNQGRNAGMFAGYQCICFTNLMAWAWGIDSGHTGLINPRFHNLEAWLSTWQASGTDNTRMELHIYCGPCRIGPFSSIHNLYNWSCTDHCRLRTESHL